MAGPQGEVKSKSKAKKLVRSLSKGFRKSLKRMSSGLSSAFSDRKSVIGKDDLDVLDQIAADMTRTEDSPRNSDSPDFLIKAYHPDDASPSERDLSSSRTSQARSLSGASIELGPNGDASVPEPAPAATALDSHQDLAVSSPVEACAEKVSNMTTTEDKLAADRDLKADDASMSQELAALAEEVMDLERALTQLKQDSLYSSDSVAHTSGSDSGSHDDSADDDVQLPLAPQQQAAVVPPPHQDAAEDQHLMEPLQAEAPAQATTIVLECADSDTVLEGSDTVLEGSDTVLEDSDTVLEGSDTVVQDGDTVLEDSTLKVEEEVLDEVPAGAEHTTVPADSKEIALVAGPLQLIGKIVFRFATSRVTKAMLLSSASMMVGGVFRGKQRPGHNSSSCCSSQKKKMMMQAKWQ